MTLMIDQAKDYVKQARVHLDEGGILAKLGEPAARSLLEICEQLIAEFERRNALEHVAQDGTTRKSHYGAGRQPWDDIRDAGWGPEFCAGNVLKYLRRSKDEAHSIESARRYYQWLEKLAWSDDRKIDPIAIDVMRKLNDELSSEEHVKVHPGASATHYGTIENE